MEEKNGKRWERKSVVLQYLKILSMINTVGRFVAFRTLKIGGETYMCDVYMHMTNDFNYRVEITSQAGTTHALLIASDGLGNMLAKAPIPKIPKEVISALETQIAKGNKSDNTCI